MRINMTYRNGFMTSADFSPTIGSDVFTEGRYEGLLRGILTTDCDVADFQFQIGAVSWTTADGRPRERILDGGKVMTDGSEWWFEVKAHSSWLQDPDVADELDWIQEALAPYRIGLERVDGSTLLDPIRLGEVAKVLRWRNVPFGETEVRAAREVVDRSGGVAPLALVREALGGRTRQAHARACAMLIRREIGFDVRTPPGPDTPVHVPRHPRRRLSRFEG